MESVLDRGVKEGMTTDTEWLDVMMEVCDMLF